MTEIFYAIDYILLQLKFVSYFKKFIEQTSRVCTIFACTQGSLRNFIRTKEAGLSDDVECLKSFTRQILEGVCFLHQLDPVILHRDIKGGNILMDKTHTCIKLADFGCAKEVLLVR